MPMSRIGGRSRTGRGPSAAGWGLRNLVEVVKRRGADASAVLHAAGLEGAALDDPDLRIDAARAYRAWEAAVALTGEADLGLIVAGSQPAGAFDLLEYAFRASPTLGRAFEQIARYRRVVRDDLEVSLAEDGGRVAIAFTLGAARPAPPAAGRLLPFRLAAHRARGHRPRRPRPAGDARDLSRARERRGDRAGVRRAGRLRLCRGLPRLRPRHDGPAHDASRSRPGARAGEPLAPAGEVGAWRRLHSPPPFAPAWRKTCRPEK